MQNEIVQAVSFWDYIQGLSGTVWVAVGLVAATIFWFLKWAFTVLFIQGKGISLVTVPFTRLATKVLEDKFAQRLNDAKALPKLHIPRNWEEFNRFTGYVAQRMSTYRDLIYMVQSRFNGPSAICMRIAVRYFEPGFVQTFETAERGFRNFDRVDAEIRGIHHTIHSELSAATNRLERQRIATEKELEMTRLELKLLYAEMPLSVWMRRRGWFVSAVFGWFFNRIWRAREANGLRNRMRELSRELVDLRKRIVDLRADIFRRHEAQVVGLCLELIEHDQMFLQTLYHRFWLELESLTFTVATGQLMKMLAHDSDAGERARDELGLSDLNSQLEAQRDKHPVEVVRAYLRSDKDFRTYVGLGPEAVLEASLEPYFRIKLMLGRIALPGYSTHWIAHLPPPAEFGRAQASYDHFSHQLAWLKKPIPGLNVLENGLIEIEGDDDMGEPAIAAE